MYPWNCRLKNLVKRLFKKHGFGRLFNSQYVKGAKKFPKSAWEHFYHVFSSLWEKLTRKISPLVIREILGMFVKRFTADENYPGYLKIEKHFFSFLFNFWNLHQILNILGKKMMVIANVFPKLQNVKNLVRPLSKKHDFRTLFVSQHVQAS